MQRRIVISFVGLLASAGAVLGFSFQAFADTTSEDAADYRSAVMTSLRGHVGAASMIARGLVDYGDIVGHARGLASSAMELDHLFPKGSNVGESEALPVIWEKPEEFAAAVEKLQTATSAFVAAAESGDKEAIGAAFRNVGMSCRGCHDEFRVAHD
jgi:cytochrome c556